MAENIREIRRSMGDGDSLSSWQLIDDAELMQQPDPEWLVEGMLGRRTVGALYGPTNLSPP